MNFAIWCAIIGVLLITMAVTGSLLKRLPVSTAILYLAAGFGLGPVGLGLLNADPFVHTELFERLAEIAVLVSLFVTGLKLSLPFGERRWYLPLRLATVSMVITIALIAIAAMLGLGFSLGAAILLGAILAPTDPVLASDVQVENAGDRDRLRFSLTGEAGLNDGTAFPFVMLGLGLLGVHDLGAGGWRWLAVDVVWGVFGGLAIGAALGYVVGKLVVYLRVHYQEAVGLNEFLALGLIALSYGVAVLVHALGFLAVFAAGLALRRIGKQSDEKSDLHAAVQEASISQDVKGDAEDAVATHPEHATAHMTHAMLGFNEQLERIVEIAVVLIIGAMLWYTFMPHAMLWFAPALFVLIRPVSVWLGLLGSQSTTNQRWLIGWFGIRGIGSIYYLMYAINHGLPRALADQLVAITLVVVTTSIVLHGISVTPLMMLYARRRRGRV
jgi:NhaP-type Na+/H+ or K+/H+ antiporter